MKNYSFPILLAIGLVGQLTISQAQSNLVITQPASDTPGSTNTIIKVNYQPADQDGKTLTGTDNIFLGYSAGNAYYLSTSRSTIVGAGAAAYTNRRSTAITTDNTLLGAGAGGYLLGSFNTFTGSGAGGAVPANQGSSVNTGAYNLFSGYQTGFRNTTGSYNAYVGQHAGFANTTGSNNAFVGSEAGYGNTMGSNNAFVGVVAGFNNQSGSNNAFMGYQAGVRNTTGYANVTIGASAAYTNQIGNYNIAIGDSAGFNNTVSGNVFLGSKSGYTNQSGDQNTYLGYQAGYSATATANTFIGFQAGRNVTTGSNNIIIGPNSGTAVTNGSENVLMGYNSQAEDGLHNATAIGAGSRVALSNALILGNRANVGIGTSAPTAPLHIRSEQMDESGLRLEQLTSHSPVTTQTDQFLTVNQTGEVIKARYQLRISDTGQWSDKVFSPTYRLRTLASVASYISQHGHLPGVPSAEQVVKEGVDLVKMNATLLEKIEELTLYSIQQQQEIERLRQQQAKIDELQQLVKQLLNKNK